MTKLLTKKEVAEGLRVSTRTVCRYIKTGHLTPIRLSEQVTRFSQEEVDRFIKEGLRGRLEK